MLQKGFLRTLSKFYVRPHFKKKKKEKRKKEKRRETLQTPP
jgi:hypothetical protein